MNWRNMQFSASRFFSWRWAAIALVAIVLIIYFGHSSIDQNQQSTTGSVAEIDDGSLVVRGMLSLILIIGLIVALAVVVRKMNFRGGTRKNAGQVQIISSVFIGSKKQIVLVRIMDRVLALGITEASINKLAEFPGSVQDEVGTNEEKKQGADFMTLLEGWRK